MVSVIVVADTVRKVLDILKDIKASFVYNMQNVLLNLGRISNEKNAFPIFKRMGEDGMKVIVEVMF